MAIESTFKCMYASWTKDPSNRQHPTIKPNESSCVDQTKNSPSKN
jgi:hypothetical protein